MRRSSFRSLGLAAAAFGSGAALVVLFPPYGFWWLAPVVLLPILAVLARTSRPLGGMALGLWFGMGMGLAGGGWLYGAITAEFDVARKIGLAVATGVVLVSIWPFALFGGLTVWLGRRRQFSWLAPCVAWGSAEWFRLAGPFPWLRLGDGLSGQSVWVQPAAVGGVALLSFGIVAVNALLHEALRERRMRALLAALAVVAAWGSFGAARLVFHPLQDSSLTVGLVQVATPQRERWQQGSWERNLERQLVLTEQAQAAGARLIVWSETAIDTVPAQIPDLEDRLGARLEADLVTGILLERPDGRLTNSIAGFDPSGRRVARYDKVLLVPWTEELPRWLEERPRLRRRLRRLAANASYAAGESSAPIEVAGLRIGALICYEAMFPELSRRAVAQGAELLVNLSNDAFFGRHGAAQHAAMGWMRSVELGRPMLRVSNRGPGFAVDAVGRNLAHVGGDEVTARVVELDVSGIETLYALGGHGFDEALLVVAALGCLASGRGARRPDAA